MSTTRYSSLACCLVTLLFLAVLPSAFADVTITQKTEGKMSMMGKEIPMNSATTIKLKGKNMRTEILDSKGVQQVVIRKGDIAFMVSPATKTYFQVDLNQFKGLNGEAAKAPGEFKATGKSDTINGYKAEEYIWGTGNAQMSFWFTKELDKFKKVLTEASSGLDAMGGFMPDPKDFPGYPVRTVMSFGGSNITTTLQTIKEGDLGDGEFEVPKEFSKTEAPFGSLPGGAIPHQ